MELSFRSRNSVSPNQNGHSVMQLSFNWVFPIGLVTLVAIPLLFGHQSYWLNVFANANLLAFASLGVWVTFAIGRVNVGQGAFAMVGGYVAGILTNFLGIDVWFSLPVAALICALIGVIIGWPLLRLKGVYFAMATLAFTEAVRLIFLNSQIGGLTNIPWPSGITSMLSFYFLSAVLLMLGFLVIWRLAQSRIGHVFEAIRENEELATSVGINVAAYRVLAFAICSAMGGVSGAIFASFQQNIFPGSYTVADSINFMLYCFLGGLSYIAGPIIGTFVLVVGFELLRGIQQYQALLYGVLMISLMLIRPNGILSLGELFYRKPGRDPLPKSATARRDA